MQKLYYYDRSSLLMAIIQPQEFFSFFYLGVLIKTDNVRGMTSNGRRSINVAFVVQRARKVFGYCCCGRCLYVHPYRLFYLPYYFNQSIVYAHLDTYPVRV